jgi:uncharacterized membrane protein YfcA
MGDTLAFLLTGLLVGVFGGLLGIGGAIILVPALIFVFGFSQARAQGTSIGALVPPIGIFAAIHYYRNGLLDLRAAALIAAGFAAGALGGASLVPYVPQVWLRRAFATVLVVVAAQMMLAEPGKKLGAVLPSVLAGAVLWALFFLKRIVTKKPPPGAAPPSDDDVEYHI